MYFGLFFLRKKVSNLFEIKRYSVFYFYIRNFFFYDFKEFFGNFYLFIFEESIVSVLWSREIVMEE